MAIDSRLTLSSAQQAQKLADSRVASTEVLRLSDQWIRQLGTHRRSEIRAKIGNSGEADEKMIADYLAKPIYAQLGLSFHFYFPMNESTGNLTEYVSGNSLSVTGATVGVGGSIGKAVLFDGTNDLLDTNYAPNLAADSSFSAVVVVKIAQDAGAGEKVILAAKNTGSSEFLLEVNSGNPQAYMSDGSGNAMNIFSNAVDLRDDTWHTVAFVKDRSITTGTMYVDGVSRGTASDNWAVACNLSGDNLYVGARNNAGTPDRYLKLVVQHVALINTALSAGQVSSLSKIFGTS